MTSLQISCEFGQTKNIGAQTMKKDNALYLFFSMKLFKVFSHYTILTIAWESLSIDQIIIPNHHLYSRLNIDKVVNVG